MKRKNTYWVRATPSTRWRSRATKSQRVSMYMEWTSRITKILISVSLTWLEKSWISKSIPPTSPKKKQISTRSTANRPVIFKFLQRQKRQKGQLKGKWIRITIIASSITPSHGKETWFKELLVKRGSYICEMKQ